LHSSIIITRQRCSKRLRLWRYWVEREVGEICSKACFMWSMLRRAEEGSERNRRIDWVRIERILRMSVVDVHSLRQAKRMVDYGKIGKD
jgi:hypothetical protein